jgi:hypothetical protein
MDIMDKSKPAQLSVRKEVKDFVLAAEKLLSPILLSSELTKEECQLICEYLTTMCRGTHPWSSEFVTMQPAPPVSRKAPSMACRDQHTKMDGWSS